MPRVTNVRSCLSRHLQPSHHVCRVSEPRSRCDLDGHVARETHLHPALQLVRQGGQVSTAITWVLGLVSWAVPWEAWNFNSTLEYIWIGPSVLISSSICKDYWFIYCWLECSWKVWKVLQINICIHCISINHHLARGFGSVVKHSTADPGIASSIPPHSN